MVAPPGGLNLLTVFSRRSYPIDYDSIRFGLSALLGSGFVWTVQQMGAETAKRVHEANLNSLRARAATFIETNAIYALARKVPA